MPYIDGLLDTRTLPDVELSLICFPNAELSLIRQAQTWISPGTTKPDANLKSRGHRMRVHRTDVHCSEPNHAPIPLVVTG
ncbi:unnamed protein product [Linum trigynum]|uniref:Uncharacterized protein n=1 Tax=Linum trigynum TaxID=586398 RepID=A0AAV2EE84_9ROSI